MSVTELSVSTQNYLKAIWSLGEWSTQPVTASALAARVGVRTSTVSDAVRKLSAQGLLEHSRYGSISLTDEGRAHAVAMIRRHRLIETFLVRVLSYRWEQVHDEAEHLEHAVSDFMVQRMDEYLGHPARDPHGDPIPTADGQVQRPDAVLLSEVGPETRVMVERVSDDDPALLSFFTEHGIEVGTELEVGSGAPFSGTIEVAVAGGSQSLPLGTAAAGAVWVSAITS